MPEGTVITQSPKDGKVDIGATVKITVAQQGRPDPTPTTDDRPPERRPRPEPDDQPRRHRPRRRRDRDATASRRGSAGRRPSGDAGGVVATSGLRPAERATASGVAADLQPVGEHPVAALGEHRLGVELHAVAAAGRVPQGHDDAVGGAPVTCSSSGRVSGSIASEW